MGIKSTKISRRNFVGAMGAGAVISASGMAVAAMADEATGEQTWDDEADVVVVGLGAAGAAAAIEAINAGASVCVIEKAERGGGATIRSGGIIYMGGGTGLQTTLGVEDTPENMRAYVTKAAGPSADAELLDVFCSESLGLYDWLVEQGVSFDGKLDDVSHYASTNGFTDICLIYSGNERAKEYRDVATSVPRGHVPIGCAVGLYDALEAVVEAGADMHYSTTATDLVTDEAGAIIGVVATDASGASLRFKANGGVVISAGAFTYNDQMVSDANADALLCGRRTGFEYDLGDGIRMAQRVGAATRSMSRINASEFLYLYGDLASGTLLDYRGLRMLAEDWYGAWIGREVLERTPEACYVFVDDPMYQNIKANAFGAYLEPVAQADTIDALAEAVGLPVASAVESVERYNGFCEAGEDADYYKSAEYLKPIATAPFYAFASTPALTSFHTLGGLKINTQAQVVNHDGEPIAGLYAAGRSSCGIFGEYPGSGSSIADSLTFGRIAGQQAAANK